MKHLSMAIAGALMTVVLGCEAATATAVEAPSVSGVRDAADAELVPGPRLFEADRDELAAPRGLDFDLIATRDAADAELYEHTRLPGGSVAVTFGDSDMEAMAAPRGYAYGLRPVEGTRDAEDVEHGIR